MVFARLGTVPVPSAANSAHRATLGAHGHRFGAPGSNVDLGERRGRQNAQVSLGDRLQWLDRHVNLEAQARAGKVEGLSLERMRTLVEALGDPQTAFPVIHLTGTNGKGSTARMITALLAESGLTVGTYTSPHLERINE